MGDMVDAGLLPGQSGTSFRLLAVLETHSFQQSGMSFFPYWKKEPEAARNGCVLMDMSFMSKFLVQGRDEAGGLNRPCTANINGPVGWIY